jgi:hypothetical protein
MTAERLGVLASADGASLQFHCGVFICPLIMRVQNKVINHKLRLTTLRQDSYGSAEF